MTRLAFIIIMLLTTSCLVTAQDRKPMDRKTRLFAAVPYLSSGIPEQVEAAEKIISRDAKEQFVELRKLLDKQPAIGRERLLRILASTDHQARIVLFIDTLCDDKSGRGERIIAFRTLSDVDQSKLLVAVEERLGKKELSNWETIQCCYILGTIASARGQGLVEDIAENAENNPVLRFAAEDALLRSVLASSFAQPAWARYQKRFESAPKCTLSELRAVQSRLSSPAAGDREDAQVEFSELVDGDERLLLACSRSKWREEALFGLSELAGRVSRENQIPALLVLLNIATTGSQAVALEAVSTAITLNPPTSEELASLREFVARDGMKRLKIVVEQLQRGGDLAQARNRARKLAARLRPLMLRQGPFNPRVRRLIPQLASVRKQLSRLEAMWAEGWRKEFQADIMGISKK